MQDQSIPERWGWGEGAGGIKVGGVEGETDCVTEMWANKKRDFQEKHQMKTSLQ